MLFSHTPLVRLPLPPCSAGKDLVIAHFLTNCLLSVYDAAELEKLIPNAPAAPIKAPATQLEDFVVEPSGPVAPATPRDNKRMLLASPGPPSTPKTPEKKTQFVLGQGYVTL